MGQMFDEKSKQGKYFEQPDKFESGLASYSLVDQSIAPPKRKGQFDYPRKGGIPLSWREDDERVYMDHTDSHSLIIGPTGSKKSRLVAMPMIEILAAAGESMIISDPKAELYNRTSRILESKSYKVSIINLRAPEYGSCWNPLTIPYRLYCKNEVDRAHEFVNDMAEILTKMEASDKEPFWDNSAGSLFFGLALLLFKYCKENNISESYVHMDNLLNLRNTMFGGSIPANTTWFWDYAKEDDFIKTSLIGIVPTASDTRAGILSVFDEKMRHFKIQPNLLEMLSANTNFFDNIDKAPTAIFLIMPDEKTSYHKLVSLFIKQSYEYLIFKAQETVGNKALSTGYLNTRVNYILDEFSSLPTIKDFPTMVTAARSRNIRFNLFIQSKHQLLLRYAEEAETILANCFNWIVLRTRELKLLDEIATLCGNMQQEGVVKPVISIAELQRLEKSKGEALILRGALKPYLARLPDINVYDGGREHLNKLTRRSPLPPSKLDFEEIQKVKRRAKLFAALDAAEAQKKTTPETNASTVPKADAPTITPPETDAHETGRESSSVQTQHSDPPPNKNNSIQAKFQQAMQSLIGETSDEP